MVLIQKSWNCLMGPTTGVIGGHMYSIDLFSWKTGALLRCGCENTKEWEVCGKLFSSWRDWCNFSLLLQRNFSLLVTKWLLSLLCSSLSFAVHSGKGQRKHTMGSWSKTNCDWHWSFHWLFESYEATLVSQHFSLCSVSKSVCSLNLRANTKYLIRVPDVKIKPLFKFSMSKWTLWGLLRSWKHL